MKSLCNTIDDFIVFVVFNLLLFVTIFRVLVLDKGQIQEFDTPAALLLTENSIFSGMAREANIISKTN